MREGERSLLRLYYKQVSKTFKGRVMAAQPFMSSRKIPRASMSSGSGLWN
jgi:hypothetical protein